MIQFVRIVTGRIEVRTHMKQTTLDEAHRQWKEEKYVRFVDEDGWDYELRAEEITAFAVIPKAIIDAAQEKQQHDAAETKKRLLEAARQAGLGAIDLTDMKPKEH